METNDDLEMARQDQAIEYAKTQDLEIIKAKVQEAYGLLVPFVEKYGGQFQTDFPHCLIDESQDLLTKIREFVDFIEDYENYDLG